MIDANPRQEQKAEWCAPMLVNLNIPETKAGVVSWPTEVGLVFFPTVNTSVLVGTSVTAGS